MEVEDNHFRHVPVGEIQNTLGSLDAASCRLTRFDKDEKKELTTSEAFMDSFNGILHIGEAWGKMMGRSLAEADDVFGDDEDYNVTLDDIPGRLKKTREDLRPKKDKITGDPRLPQ